MGYRYGATQIKRDGMGHASGEGKEKTTVLKLFSKHRSVKFTFRFLQCLKKPENEYGLLISCD